jgi:hypothetical protein
MLKTIIKKALITSHFEDIEMLFNAGIATINVAENQLEFIKE